MDFDRSKKPSSDLAIDVLIDFTKKLFSEEKIKKLNHTCDKTEKVKILHEIVFGEEKMVGPDYTDMKCVINQIEDKLSDVAAKRYIEEGIKKEVIRRMELRENEYLNEMKLQVIKKHAGVENASTLKKYAQLEKIRQISLSGSLLDVMRPKNENEIIGQKDAVSSLISKIASPFPQHVILYGPPGVGKTTAARIALEIAKKRSHTPFRQDARFVEVDATTLRWDPRESVNPLLGSVHDPIFQGANKDFAEMGIPEPKPGLVTEAHGGVLFIDEIGELDAMFQNKLLKVLEDKRVKFDSSYYDLNNDCIPKYIKTLFEHGAPADFVLIGATTRSPEEMNPALRSRCAEVFFNPLDSCHIVDIVEAAAKKLQAVLSHEGATLISNYTYEARKAVNILADCYSGAINKTGREDCVKIELDCIKETISKGRYIPVNKNKSSSEREAGRIFGLGVNGFSGSIIEFEAVSFEKDDESGNTRFNETAGTMTKDSLFNALSVVRGLTGKNISKYDIHVNCIGGAKVDGPSAGAAITCLLYSTIMDAPARLDTCITGEISIRGKVRPVGGVIEKIQAAKRHGFKHVIIPYENREEAIGISGINVIAAGNIEEVVEFMFGKQPL